MATADQLLELIFCWIKEKERFADNLRKLAKELESLRENCNFSECIGSSITVLGAVGMIGAGAATVVTGGAAAPLMLLASIYTGIGSTLSLGTKIVEFACSSMKKVENIEEKSKKIANEIQKLFQKLKSEKKEVNPLAEPVELEHHVMVEFLRAIARQSGLNFQIINDSMLNDMLIRTLQEFPLEKISDTDSRGAGEGSSSAGTRRRSEEHFGHWTGISKTKSTPQMRQTFLDKHKGTKQLISILCVGVLSVVFISIKGKIKLSAGDLKLLNLIGFQTGSQTGFQAGVMVFSGLAVMTVAVPELIDSWTEMIKGNHVTEASRSLRDTACGIQKTTQILKEQIKRIKKMLHEIEQEQKLQEFEQMQQKLHEFVWELQETEQKQQTLQENKQEEQTLQEIEEEESSEEEDPPAIKVGLLNVRSIKSIQNMKERRLKIKNLITENNLDVFLITETWLENDTAAEALRETAPLNFDFHHQPREDKGGGGVAILFSQELHSERIDLGVQQENFEYVATALRHDEWDEGVLFVNVYHPPVHTTREEIGKFIDKFELLTNASTCYNRIIVAGDFNVSVEDTYNLKTIVFKQTYKNHDMVQHVKKPTHKKGGILDLVLSLNVEVFSVDIRDDGVSDHFTVYFSAKPPSKMKKLK